MLAGPSAGGRKTSGRLLPLRFLFLRADATLRAPLKKPNEENRLSLFCCERGQVVALQRHGATAQGWRLLDLKQKLAAAITAGLCFHRLNKVHDLSLRLYVGFNVPLRRAQSGMTGQHLHVSQRAAYH